MFLGRDLSSGLLKKDQPVTHSAQRVPRKVRNCLLLSDASLEQTQEAGEMNQNTDRIISVTDLAPLLSGSFSLKMLHNVSVIYLTCNFFLFS